MNNKLRKVLKKLEENGFEAYIVGGFVRDYILGIESTDIDICTNALPKDIIKIFKVIVKPKYGSFSINDGKYLFDITTYRSESDYKNRRPQQVEYVDNLITDIKRRDFTINSLCMNSRGQIIDILNGKEDINNRIIKVIGDLNQKLTEDPLRILRAIRFSVTLDFSLDKEIIDFIKSNKHLINTLSYTKKEEELNKIFSSKRAEYGLKLLKELDLLEYLGINYSYVNAVPDILGVWAQIDFDEKYPFTKSSLDVIKKIRKIISTGKINKITLFKNDLYVLIVAGEILGYSRKEITRMYSNLPIKNIEDIKIKSTEILKLLNIKPSKKLGLIYEDLVIKILNLELKNNNTFLKKYILNKWK
ncbi:MAG: nucleotidyltransferase [Bacilli bacterium]|nr:nucleotidyltransferase [Bacilli bacterium]